MKEQYSDLVYDDNFHEIFKPETVESHHTETQNIARRVDRDMRPESELVRHWIRRIGAVSHCSERLLFTSRRLLAFAMFARTSME